MREPGGGFVLVGYDESPGSEQALRWAVQEARLRGRPVVVCHAWHWPYALRPASRTLLAEVEQVAARIVEEGVRRVRALGGAPDVRPLLVKRPAAAVLLEAAQEAELVVLGSRRVGGFEDLRVGSAAVQVPAHSPAPVIVVRPNGPSGEAVGIRQALADPGGPSGQVSAHPGGRSAGSVGGERAIAYPMGEEAGGVRVVVGLDGSPASEAAFRFALREAELRGGSLEAVCGWWDSCDCPGEDERPFVDARSIRAAAEAGFREAVRRLASGRPNVPVTADFVTERPPRAIVERASGAALLVLGHSGRRAGVLIGPVIQTALTEVRCPVAVTPPPHSRKCVA
ncbi:universal stress protein [Nonomuraea sp. NPDC049309]|uniref:universal stress protein n=1 Tax=Nonomuraea sp. NPDC049309 TaxID=3364350 RepID=UPI00371BC7B7